MRRFILLRCLDSVAWSNGFWWGFKMGRLAVETRLQYEYKKLEHAPRRSRMAARRATMHVHDEHLDESGRA